MAPEGATRVEITGVDDKRQITAVFAVTLSRSCLPPQIMYKGKTQKCLPTVHFPDSWHITYIPNHWAIEKTTEDYIDKILLPYVTKKQKHLGIKSAIVIFDRFKGQCTPQISQLLDRNNIHVVLVPGNRTDKLQLLDISVNKSIKEYLRAWYAEQMLEGTEIVNLKTNVMKPLGAKWLMEMYDHMLMKPQIIINGFKGAGIFPKS